MASKLQKIAIYCGSASGNKDIYKNKAIELANNMVEMNLDLVYGGASIGIMGTLADTILNGKREVVGVITELLKNKEIAHQCLSELVIVEDMHARKSMMANMADAFIAFPGGLGTFDELCEVLAWNQLNIINKPVGLLNVNGYFDNFIAQLDHGVSEGFIKQQHRDILCIDSNPKQLLIKLNNYSKEVIDKWWIEEKNYAEEKIRLINSDTLDNISKKAKNSDRKRQIHNFHYEYSDLMQRMLNAVEPDSYIQPHKHANPDKREVFMALRGKFCVAIFDDNGKIIEKHILDPKTENYGIEIAADIWHTLFSLEEGSVAYELKDGPYSESDDKCFAPWAPREGEAGTAEYLERLVNSD